MVCPTTGLNVPAGQGAQSAWDTPPGRLLYEPAGQAAHASAPLAAENAPGEQGVQVGLLGKGEKVPGGHRVHASPRLAPPTAPAA